MKPSIPTPRDPLPDGRADALVRRLQGIASTAVVMGAVVAGSVVAASEALQEAPGDAIVVFRDALAGSFARVGGRLP
ncbi:hypothetical protein [Variovorax paradoxus]|jgi:hypothetical protein|uniref:Uncharacterized protein n=1 Tax=Variovorax paradoxus TaxID=34073 RepID=A0A679JKB3_VARPD|nr:hypothetical protein VVAX_05712 [Variovorax paradoxus]